MAALPVRADWLKLYKELLRAGREFPQYSYKHFARRRVRDYFEHSRTENLSESRLVEMYEEGKKSLVSFFWKILNLGPSKLTSEGQLQRVRGLKYFLEVISALLPYPTITRENFCRLSLNPNKSILSAQIQ
uniref:Complex 1 LYR protein domain-containing protein n=1 Tax=Meloidogyne enterolobii TaxID=390850 RepID=A0A6V7Y306_MELEN|nr:unnamed protein product [Meloidogyne enterolobii]